MNLLSYDDIVALPQKAIVEAFVATILKVKSPGPTSELSEAQQEYGIHPQSIQVEMDDGNLMILVINHSDMHVSKEDKGKTLLWISPTEDGGDPLGISKNKYGAGKWNLQVSKYAQISSDVPSPSPAGEPEPETSEEPEKAQEEPEEELNPLALAHWKSFLGCLKRTLSEALDDEQKLLIKLALKKAIFEDRDKIPGLNPPGTAPVPDSPRPETDLAWKKVNLAQISDYDLAVAMQALAAAENNQAFTATKRGAAKKKRQAFTPYIHSCGLRLYDLLVILGTRWDCTEASIAEEFDIFVARSQRPDTEDDRESLALEALRQIDFFKTNCEHNAKEK